MKDVASEFLPVLCRQYSMEALDSLRVLRKYIRKQPEIPDEIFFCTRRD